MLVCTLTSSNFPSSFVILRLFTTIRAFEAERKTNAHPPRTMVSTTTEEKPLGGAALAPELDPEQVSTTTTVTASPASPAPSSADVDEFTDHLVVVS